MIIFPRPTWSAQTNAWKTATLTRQRERVGPIGSVTVGGQSSNVADPCLPSGQAKDARSTRPVRISVKLRPGVVGTSRFRHL